MFFFCQLDVSHPRGGTCLPTPVTIQSDCLTQATDTEVTFFFQSRLLRDDILLWSSGDNRGAPAEEDQRGGRRAWRQHVPEIHDVSLPVQPVDYISGPVDAGGLQGYQVLNSNRQVNFSSVQYLCKALFFKHILQLQIVADHTPFASRRYLRLLPPFLRSFYCKVLSVCCYRPYSFFHLHVKCCKRSKKTTTRKTTYVIYYDKETGRSWKVPYLHNWGKVFPSTSLNP